MNHEESRLRTFNSWPPDCPVDSARIANGGFYYTGQGMEVQCFSCGGKISEWLEGDHVMSKHRRLDPRCPFIVNPAMSGNVPKLPHTANSNNLPAHFEVISTDRSDQYLTEDSRLASFVNWHFNHIVTPQNLAKAGFFSLREGDKVKCPYCKGIVGYWEIGDEPKSEHIRHFPTCAFVLSNFGETPVDMSIIEPPKPTDLQELGIQTHRGPRQADYATVESRIRTFTSWPVDLIQTPEMLSEAGFYYVGTGDQVRCFHCDGGLRHWDPQDEPWVEHARWFPSCSFLRIVKGVEFIKSCTPDVKTTESKNDPRSKRSMPGEHHEVSEADVQAYMNTPAVLDALNIGIDVGRVKNAIRYKLQVTGVGFSCADTLIEAALNLDLEDFCPQDHDSAEDIRLSEEVSGILSSILIQSEKENKNSEKVEPKSKSQTDCSEVSTLSLEEENRLLREARLCKICMDNEIGIVFLPCGHLTTCVNCAPSLKDCPVCRSVIKATVRTFLS